MNAWENKARQRQQTFSRQLGNKEWDITEKKALVILLQDLDLVIDLDRRDDIFERICNTVEEINEGIGREDILFSCIVVIGKVWDDPYTIPVFLARKKTDKSPLCYFDTDCRIFSSWTDYLNHITLSKRMYCCPHDGCYSLDNDDNVLIDFATLDSSDTIKISLFQKIFAIKISLFQKIFANADEVTGNQGKYEKITLSILIIGIVIFSCFIDIERKYILSFYVILLIVSYIVFDFKTSAVTKILQHHEIGQLREILSPVAKKLFNKHTGKLRGPHEIPGNAEIFKTLKKMNNKQELYEIMAHPDVTNDKVKLYPGGLRGLLNVNNELKVHPQKYLELGLDTRRDILNATRQLKNDPTKVNESNSIMEDICNGKRLSFDERAKLITGVREALKRLETQDFGSKLKYQEMISNAENCLLAIYKAGLSRIEFHNKEKLEFGTLVQKALPAIGCRINHIVSDFPPGSVRSSKIERSGLQFLFDDYKDFPVSENKSDTTDLNQTFSDFREEEDVEEWDECLRRNVIDDLEPRVCASTNYTPDVPASHWWFFREKNNLTSKKMNRSECSECLHVECVDLHPDSDFPNEFRSFVNLTIR